MSRSHRTRLSSRFIRYYAIAYLVMIGLMGVIVDGSTRSALIADVDRSLAIAASLAEQSVPDDASGYGAWAQAAYDAAGFRSTLIDEAGVVLADSHSDPDVMENHLDRPEIQIALTGEMGEAQRISDSTGFEQRYVAMPPTNGLIVRMSVPTRVVDDQQWLVRRSIMVTAAALGVLGIALMAFLARRLASPIAQLTEQARAVADGEVGVHPRRSRVEELDRLGLAISAMAARLGSRVSDAEAAAETLEVVLAALSQGTVLVDGDDRIVYSNPAAGEILGSVPNSLANLAPLQFQSAVRDARGSGESVSTDLDHGNPTRRLRGVATPFIADDRVLLLVVDITQSERTDSVRRDFVANASHELKTPVATIIASSQAMQIALDRGDASVSGFATRIEGSARQLDRLVADLLDLSRLESERPEMAPVRLDHLVRDEVERIGGEIAAGGITIDKRYDNVTATVNYRDMAIAIRNILDNAARHTSEGGSISVVVSIEGSDAVISVADSGEGIPTRDAERVFERFYRVDSARSRATGGTGLGLAIVKHVVESHGGSVDLESELGVGSTVTIRLPLGAMGQGLGAN